MEQTVAILAFAIMAVGLITIIIGIAEFIKMLTPPDNANRDSSTPTEKPELTVSRSN